MDERTLASLMAESLGEGLCELRGRAVNIERVERTPFRGSSSFATARLRVLADGVWLDVFFKDLNPLHQLVEARGIRATALERSRRELHVYRHILRDGALGAAALLGWRWAPSQGLLWLFLEDVGPKRLSRLGDFSLWVAAARWSARLHASSHLLPAGAFAPLPRPGPDDYEQCACELRAKLDRFPGEHQRAIGFALDRYREISPRLNQIPHTLVHNEFFGKNVIIRPAPVSEPIAVIDWETAAIGPAYIDLVSISTGRWTLAQRLQMWRAYFEEARPGPQTPADWHEFCNDVHAVALHHALRWLSWWSKGDDAHIQRWLTELQRVIANYGRSAPAESPSAERAALEMHEGVE